MEGILQELIVSLKEIAPEVWAILIRQVYVNAVAQSVLAFLLLVIAVASFVALKRAQDNYDDDYGSFWNDCSGAYWTVPLVVCAIAFVLLAIIAAQAFANPEYYAIQLLISQIK